MSKKNLPSNPDIDSTIAVEFLESNNHHTKEEERPKRFSEDELIQMKEEIYVLTSQIGKRKNLSSLLKIAAEKASDPLEVIAEILEKTDGFTLGEVPVTDAAAILAKTVAQVDKGYETVAVTIYAFDYQESGRMAYYGPDGDYIYDRPLEPHERQTSILSYQKRTGTEG